MDKVVAEVHASRRDLHSLCLLASADHHGTQVCYPEKEEEAARQLAIPNTAVAAGTAH
jgi:hypothetical protein